MAEIPYLPGFVSQGQTIDEVIENIRDAIQGYLQAVLSTCGSDVNREKDHALSNRQLNIIEYKTFIKSDVTYFINYPVGQYKVRQPSCQNYSRDKETERMKHRQMEPQQNVFSGQDRDVAKGAGG